MQNDFCASVLTIDGQGASGEKWGVSTGSGASSLESNSSQFDLLLICHIHELKSE